MRGRTGRLRTMILAATTVVMLASCSTTKYLPDGVYLLTDIDIVSDNADIKTDELTPYIRRRATSSWLSTLKAGSDTTKWINRTLRKFGDEPVFYDTLQARLTCDNLRNALRNKGYLQADVTVDTLTKGKKVKAIYSLHCGEPYYIRSIDYNIADEGVAAVLASAGGSTSLLHEGTIFSADNLEAERRRITQILNDSGYYHFNKDFIYYDADSTRSSRAVDIRLNLMRYRATSSSPEEPHRRYLMRNITYQTVDDGSAVRLRRRVLERNTALTEGSPFSATALQRTYNNFARLQAVRYTNIRFAELPDTALLDCNIQISTNKANTLSFRPEGTNTAGDLGAAASLTYENRNLFRGSEVLSVQLRAAFEAITGLEGYQNDDYEEYNIETRLSFPRFIAPFLSRNFRRNVNARSELSVSYNLQNRPEFHRRVFAAAWKYYWNDGRRNTTYRLDLLDLNYVYMPWISETFKSDYLDDDSNQNAILRYNYEDLFIMKFGVGMTYNNGTTVVKINAESAGNLLHLMSNTLGDDKNADGQYTLFNIAYAQYVKGDIDITHLFKLSEKRTIATHFGLGIAYPYGNSTILPFEKRYFSGGANSVRGWSVRELGPGSFKGTDGRIDFINQTGDMKLDLNVEYRAPLFWKFDGAAFVDAGNIWTLRDYEDQPGGQFKIDEFYKQIAVSYGIGLRLSMDYFVLRLDMGMKAINPAYDSNEEHYAIVHPDLSRDFALHFAVGLPF